MRTCSARKDTRIYYARHVNRTLIYSHIPLELIKVLDIYYAMATLNEDSYRDPRGSKIFFSLRRKLYTYVYNLFRRLNL